MRYSVRVLEKRRRRSRVLQRQRASAPTATKLRRIPSLSSGFATEAFPSCRACTSGRGEHVPATSRAEAEKKIAIRCSTHEVEALMPSGCGAFACGVALSTNKRVQLTSKRSHFPSDLSCEQSPKYHGPTDEHETQGRSVAHLSCKNITAWPCNVAANVASEVDVGDRHEILAICPQRVPYMDYEMLDRCHVEHELHGPMGRKV